MKAMELTLYKNATRPQISRLIETVQEMVVDHDQEQDPLGAGEAHIDRDQAEASYELVTALGLLLIVRARLDRAIASAFAIKN